MRAARVFKSFEDAERAEVDYYASLTPEERLDVLLESGRVLQLGQPPK